MHKKTFIAGLLAVVTAIVHLVLGTPEVHAPLLRSSLPLDLRLLLYACWHLVSVALAVSAFFLVRAGLSARRATAAPLIAMIGVCWSGFGLVFVAVDIQAPARFFGCLSGYCCCRWESSACGPPASCAGKATDRIA